MHRCLTWLLGLGLLQGCVGDDPVLTGIPAKPLLTQTESNPTKRPRENARYQKSAAVYVDVRHLGGKPFHQVRDIVSDQLGRLQSTREVSEQGGREITYLRGTIRVINNTIAMIRVPLQEPLRRTAALEHLGFPPYVGGYSIFHREYRLHHEWGFRRIRLKREDRSSERVIEVEAWRWLPGERDLGR